jgi:hypothetical protein
MTILIKLLIFNISKFICFINIMIYTKIILFVVVLISMILFVYYLNIEHFQTVIVGNPHITDNKYVLPVFKDDTETQHFIQDNNFRNYPDLETIEMRNYNIYAFNSYTFNGLKKLNRVDLSGKPIKILGSNLFYDNLGNGNDGDDTKFIITPPPPNEKILIVIYPETILRLALQGVDQTLTGLCYENINEQQQQQNIYSFIQENTLGEASFKTLVHRVLGVKDGSTVFKIYRSYTFSDNNSVTINRAGNYVLTTNTHYDENNGKIPIIVPLVDGKPTLSNTNYIELQSNGVIIESDPLTISVNTPIIVPALWQGLFKTGTGSAAAPAAAPTAAVGNNFQIRNIHIKCIGTLNANGGGICRKYFGKGMLSSANLIENCSFQGAIGTKAGGICGSECGTVTINYCYSIGSIGTKAGGICGSECGTVTINNCYSTGSIEAGGGGICGSECGKLGGTVTIKNCLYNYDGCENKSITSMASIPDSTLSAQAFATDQDKFKKVIGSLASDFTSIDIDTTHYFGDMYDFHAGALLSINVGVGTTVWKQCQNGAPWLLQWQDDIGITCATLPSGGDTTCNPKYTFSDDNRIVTINTAGNYVLTTNLGYEDIGKIPIIVPLNGVNPTLSNNNYIDLQSNGVIIESDPLTISVNKPIIVPALWQGLFKNGTGSAAAVGNNFQIRNIHIMCLETLGMYGGGICRKYFGKGMVTTDNTNLIENCSFQGDIGTNAGGICGFMCGTDGTFQIKNCYSIGSIGDEAGGICGSECGNKGTVTINNCYSIGSIGAKAGGICGSYCGTDGKVTINNCYSTGSIEAGGGGICGSECGQDYGTVQIKNCLYNYDGCENNSITRMASITEPTLTAKAFATNQDQFKKVIGSLALDFKSIDIDNTHYFADMDYFHDIAILSIYVGVGVGTTVWKQCQNGAPWLLKWQDDTCATPLVGGDTTCTERFFGGGVGGANNEISYKDTFRLVYYKDMFYETDIAYWRCKYYEKPIQTTSASGSEDADDELISNYCIHSDRDESYMSCIEALQKKVEEEDFKHDANSMNNVLSSTSKPTFNYYENLLTTFSSTTGILPEIQDILNIINNLDSNLDGCPTVSACNNAQQTWLGNTGYKTDISETINKIQSASDFDAEYNLNKTNMVLSASNKTGLTESELSTCQVEMLGLESFYGGSSCQPYIIESDTKRKVLCSSFDMSIDSTYTLLLQTNANRFTGLIQKIINAGKHRDSNFILTEIELANLLYNLQTNVV